MPASPASHENTVIAVPFPHQVGGHSPCGRVVKQALVAKLVGDGRERRFYEHLLPETLRPWAPAYHGLANVLFNTEGFETASQFKYAKISETDSPVSSSAPSPDQSGSSVNPWTLKMLNKCKEKQLFSLDSTPSPCILLEDLCASFHFPCILDLKMGTRMYRDDASETKRSRSIAKVQTSTSSSHGIRICGLQRYEKERGVYFFQDKYVGRSLPGERLKPTIADFFVSCPSEYRKQTILAVASRLRQLSSTLSSVTNFRFYSSSLLIIYEGGFESADREEAKESGKESEGAFLRESERSVDLEDEHGDASLLGGFASCSVDKSESQQAHEDASAFPRIDVRMIDFANTSCLDAASSEGDGPDKGYLFGLENLIKILEEIASEAEGPFTFESTSLLTASYDAPATASSSGAVTDSQ